MSNVLRIPILESLYIDPETAAEPQLRYPNLAHNAAVFARQVPEAKQQLRAARRRGDTVTAGIWSERLATFRLLNAAAHAQQASSTGVAQRWSRQFTIISKRLFGAPDSALTRRIASHELHALAGYKGKGIDKALFDKVVHVYQSLAGQSGELLHPNEKRLCSLLGNELKRRYKGVFELLNNPERVFNPNEIAEKLEQVLHSLAQDDVAWAAWEVKLDSSSRISVAERTKRVLVGRNRLRVSGKELEGVVAHEILAHVGRAINGAKAGKPWLASGLPGYLSAEEGVAVLFEVALTGSIPEKILDRYADTALALGTGQKKPLTRAKAFAFTYDRAVLRKQASGQQFSPEELRQACWHSVNRLYRGTRGDHIRGVFTKDIVYAGGFQKMLAYVTKRHASGDSMSDIVNSLLAGKYDPASKTHSDYQASV